MAALCAACHTRRLNRGNASGVCVGCFRKGRSAMRCLCGCTRTIDRRNASGLARTCRLRLAVRVAVELARLAQEHDATSSALIAAARDFAGRSYSKIARDKLEAAFLARFPPSFTSLLGGSAP